MSKKSAVARGPLSKNSATSSAMSSVKQNAPKSSVSKSAFAPSQFQLNLFASVIQGLESEQLRIHDTNNSRLRCRHNVAAKSRITSLDWGYYNSFPQERQQGGDNKKRKREGHQFESVVVAYGTTTSEICMFSISEAKIVGKLAGGHDRGVRDFQFCRHDYSEGWSAGGDRNLLQWDIPQGVAKRRLSLEDSAVNVLSTPSPLRPQLLCASSTPYAVELTPDRVEAYDARRLPIHSLFRSGTDETHPSEMFLAVDSDRYINITELSGKKLLRTLVAGGDLESASFFASSDNSKPVLDQQMLALLRKDGIVELFSKPFLVDEFLQVNGETSKRKLMTRKSNASIQLVSRDARSTPVAVFSASLQGPELLFAIAEGGIDICFQKVRWQDEGTGELLFEGLKEVVYSRPASVLNTAMTNGIRDERKAHIDESRAVVVEGGAELNSRGDVISISSSEEDVSSGKDGSEADEDISESEDGRRGSAEAFVPVQADLNNVSDEEIGEARVQDDQPEESMLTTPKPRDEDAEPSFGDLITAQSGAVISIGGALPAESTILLPQDSNALSISGGISLSTVLNQALRTNDNNLLESCLHNQSTEIIKATIQRLDSSLAGTLIQKLAERLSSRPGRYGHLTTWVQWICVVHGGSLASQPAAVEKMRTLNRVLAQRSRCLDDLLLLKGKLDMLDAQLQYRKQLAAQRQRLRPGDDPRVVMIEGEDNWSSSDENQEIASTKKKAGAVRRDLDDLLSDPKSDADQDENEDMPATLPNGVESSSSADESSDEESMERNDQHEGALIESQAEESDEDLLGSEDDELEDHEEEEDDDDDDDQADSEMNDFINDGTISDVQEQEEEDDDDTSQKPPKKVRRV